MIRRRFSHASLVAVGAALWLPRLSRGQASSPPRKPDLADAVEGSYFGDVISDSKGSSQSDVALTVTRVRKDVVRITSDYARLPAVEVALTRAMGKILQQRGDTVFLWDSSKGSLDVSFHNEVSWAGRRR